MDYFQLQAAFFEHLWKKHQSNNEFTFSVRQVASKGAERNHFIGTSRSKYFGFTCWDIPVYFPGSSSDLTNFIFAIKDDRCFLKFQYVMARSATGTQSAGDLDFGAALLAEFKARNIHYSANGPSNKMFYFQVVLEPKGYEDIDALRIGFDKLYDLVAPSVDAAILATKPAHPNWQAQRFTLQRFNQLITRMHARIAKAQAGSLAPEEVVDKEATLEEALEQLSPTPRNTILYGPPGTGKTYHTITKSVAVANPGFDIALASRQELRKEFERLVSAGQIAFVTFHQSMSYEDFIEGIKPEMDGAGGGTLSYNIEDGVFKKICNSAASQLHVEDNFESAFARLLADIEDNDGSLVLKTLSKGKEFTIYENSKGNLRFHANTDKAYDAVIRKEVIERYLHTGELVDWPSYTKAVGEYLRTKYGYIGEKKQERKNFVLIIDEINRGNVSQIFGELITLIEDDKRAGRPEAISAILPYSKKSFSVPDNLFIIGTMNTADRSVEALDSALRRRFVFEEMRPLPELLSPQRFVWKLWWEFESSGWEASEYRTAESGLYELLGLPDGFGHDDALWTPMKKEGQLESQISVFDDAPFTGVNLDLMLRAINMRLEALLTRDHAIGHAYLIEVRSLDALRDAFAFKIIPLLQEYFYSDYVKIGLVLGDGFFEGLQAGTVKFASFKYGGDDADEFVDKPQLRFKKPHEWTISDFQKIYS